MDGKYPDGLAQSAWPHPEYQECDLIVMHVRDSQVGHDEAVPDDT